MKWLATLAAAFALLLGGGLNAQAIKEKNVVSGKTTLNPALGYIFSSSAFPMQGTFVRVPDEDDWASYRVDWEKAYAKALKNYERDWKLWETDRDRAKAAGMKVRSKPTPVPPREKFSIGPIEVRLLVLVGPGGEYLKDKQTPLFQYLTGVKPGTYIWYGHVIAAGVGTCYCMGSIQFEVKAGMITDLGDFLGTVARYEGLTLDDNINRMPGRFSTSVNGEGEVAPETARFGVPPTLSMLPSVRAEFHASGKMNNMLNLMVGRVRPIPGILAYRRGEVLDLRTGKLISMQIAPFDPDAEAGEEDDED